MQETEEMQVQSLGWKDPQEAGMAIHSSILAWRIPWTAEDQMFGWHHQLDGHEFEQALGVNDGQGRLACCSPWGCKE